MQQKGAPRSQWFHDTWHGQLVADFYNAFLVSAEKVGGTKVLIWVLTGPTLANAVLDTIRSGHPLIGLLFDRNCEHFGALEPVREHGLCWRTEPSCSVQ